MPTALIVEDEPEANKLLAMLVRLRGFQTASAYTGVEALELVRARPPDIVFLDLMLPDINGYEVCRSLKARKATSLIPVVMVTARVESENRRLCFGLGADDYVPKPYLPDQIYQAIADANAWSASVARNGSVGAIEFHSTNDEALKRLAQFRNLIVARTPLDTDAVGRITAALDALWNDAHTWGRARRADHVATLAFDIHPDHIDFTLRDASGWLAASTAARWSATFTAAAFAAWEIRDEGRTWTWRRDFAT